MTQREKTKELMDSIRKVCPKVKGSDLGYVAACIRCAYSSGAYESSKEALEINKKYGK